MTTLTYRDKQYFLPPDVSVLEGLEAAGVDILSSCRNGACQTCKKKVVSGKLPEKSQAGLKSAEQSAGYFLPCICYPTEDIVIADIDQAPQYDVSVLSVIFLNEDIAEIKLSHPQGMQYRAGQFIQVFKNKNIVRTYSLASVPEKDEPLTLQVRCLPNGNVSQWLAQRSAGDTIRIAGPFGECFYTDEKKHQPIIMLGTGSGLSPLFGILHDALRQTHQGDIYLFHGVAFQKNLYKEEHLRDLTKQFSHFKYFPCISEEKTASHEHGMVLDVATSKIPDVKGARAFLCGHPEMVKKARKKLFLAGIAMKDIYADPFA